MSRRNSPVQLSATSRAMEQSQGLRIIDISDLTRPMQVGAVQTCRGSHTHTLVTSPKDEENVWIYYADIDDDDEDIPD